MFRDNELNVWNSEWGVRYVMNARRFDLSFTFIIYMHLVTARPFASSLESLSACDMNTVHAIADPHLRAELAASGQYCGPMKRARMNHWPSKSGPSKRRPIKRRPVQRRCEDGGRDYFEEYCNSIFTDWQGCKKLATTLVDASDEELVANIKAYRDGSCKGSHEKYLYDPFRCLANRVFQVARQDLVASRLSSSHDDAVSTTEFKMTADTVPNLMAIPTHDCPILGCAVDRK